MLAHSIGDKVPMKIVLNKCKGFFQLSNDAILRLRELSDKYSQDNINRWQDFDRTSPFLVKVVEELGQYADGAFASLRIFDIPDDVGYKIWDNCGNEWIEFNAPLSRYSSTTVAGIIDRDARDNVPNSTANPYYNVSHICFKNLSEASQWFYRLIPSELIKIKCENHAGEQKYINSYSEAEEFFGKSQ